MFTFFQLAKEGCVFFIVYFFQILTFLIGRYIGIEDTYCKKILIIMITISAFAILFFKFINRLIKNKKVDLQNNIFHPQSSKMQRISLLLLIIMFCFFIVCLIMSYWVLNISFYIVNFLSFLFFIITLILSLTLEPLPDKKDILIFEEEGINYEMRVVKEMKSNKFFNRYIIPYADIYKSYIYRNVLYIEYNINSKDVKVRREFSTHSQRLKISFKDYPNLKYFILQPNISKKIKLRNFNNIKMATFS